MTSYFNDAKNKVPPQVHFDECLIDGKAIKCNKTRTIYSPIFNDASPIVIGTCGVNTAEGKQTPWCLRHPTTDALLAVTSASKAYAQGRGQWPQMTTAERIECVVKFTKMLKNVREQIVELLMWEICKTRSDAEKEVDRTIKYIYDTIAELKNLENKQSMLVSDSGVR